MAISFLAFPGTVMPLAQDDLPGPWWVMSGRRARDVMARAGYRIGFSGRDVAAARAKILLMRLLTPEQQESYREFKIIREKVGNRLYELRYYDLQVHVLDTKTGCKLENWCSYLPNAPREDTLIAQLLLLRSDPKKLRDMSGVTRQAGEYPFAWVMEYDPNGQVG